ncbi:MAG: hypothetical protein MHM6MM_003134 [Cercozoa sp. M6MM]
MPVVEEGKYIVLHYGTSGRSIIKLQAGGKLNLGKRLTVDGTPLVGQPFGTLFRAERDSGTLARVPIDEELALSRETELIDSEGDIATQAQTQRGLATNQYLRKKRAKYITYVRAMQPTTHSLHDALWITKANRILGMRHDSLAQMLAFADLRPGATDHSGPTVLVVDHCLGLLTASVAERMAGAGTLVHVHSTAGPSLDSVRYLGVSQENLVTFPMKHVGMARHLALSNVRADFLRPEERLSLAQITEQRESAKMEDTTETTTEGETPAEAKSSNRLQQYRDVATFLGQKSDALLVAARHEPCSFVLTMLDLLAPGSPVVVYSQTLEPLSRLLLHLRDEKRCVNLRLSETWSRFYQVLPNRTHPTMNMSADSGYLLTGYTVLNNAGPHKLADAEKKLAQASVCADMEEPPAKRARTAAETETSE